VIEEAVSGFPPDFEVVEVDLGAERYLRTGQTLTHGDFQTIAGCDAILLGAVGDPRVEPGVLERGVLLRLRKELDLYINLRPFPELDITIVRENTEGLYAGKGERGHELATDISINTRLGVSRCIAYAFGLAEAQSKKLTLVHKRNVLTSSGGMWSEIFETATRNYPAIETSYEHVDAAAYHLIADPSRFGIIVTENLFGDILSDVAAAVSGGLGRAASANLHPKRSTRPTRCIGLFEPIHGSAPDIANKGIADATGAIEAASMLISAVENEAILV
jgi:3-isopropylmalate dehydrogenase